MHCILVRRDIAHLIISSMSVLKGVLCCAADCCFLVVIMKAIIYVGAKITALNDKTKKQSMYCIDIQ